MSAASTKTRNALTYLNQPENRVERKPFNVWLLLRSFLDQIMQMLARMLSLTGIE
jgi:hypothetical protein